jgi:hypothetical protein
MSKEIINEGKEALERALLLMKYDMKKTLTENVEVVSEQSATQFIKGAASGAAGGAAIGSLGLGVGAVPGAIVGGLLGGLNTLFNNPKLETARKMFDACKTSPGVPTMTIEQLDVISDEINDAVNDTTLGISGTDEKGIKNALLKIKTIPDFCALIKSYEIHGDLYEDLDSEFEDDVEWKDYFVVPLRNAKRTSEKITASQNQGTATQDNTGLGCLSSLKSTGKNKAGCPKYNIGGKSYFLCSNGRGVIEGGTVTNWKCNGNKIVFDGTTIYGGGSGSSTQYTPCPANGPYKQGCKSDVVKKIQGCLGVRTTGNFGPLTQTALSKIGYSNGFTSTDVEDICNKGNSPVFASDNLVTAEKGV